MSATKVCDEVTTLKAGMNAVVIYDDFDLAAHTNAMLEKAARRTDETVLWDVKPWRLDMLNLSPAADEALTDAADAHLIVLALRQPESLPVMLLNWLEQWAKCRRVQDAALAVWSEGDTDTPAARETTELSQFAERHDLSFIFDDNDVVRDESLMFAGDLQEREVSLTPTLHGILEQPVSGYYRHWGIGE